ncbi:SGNH/GDSL hydrolase family protein [Cerasicoccus fimbriatus]|uniref:SGNH/GDSL hydrolase family protein n=1 Tax=Cerasicoccus fimbriatus TaxID=3014554 RepID=UPI0022B4E5D9|nr:SGNH/GDSL hydrolase family protein [Cerasicoccus sp. TK19100]
MKKIYVIGDSISIQYGPYLKEYLKGILSYSRKEGVDEALANLDVPKGANGGDSSMVLQFLRSQVESDQLPFDYVLFNCGLHDIKTNPQTKKRQICLEAYKENLQDIVKLFDHSATKLIWMRTTPLIESIHNERCTGFHRFESDCESYNEAADIIMSQNSIPAVDLYGFTKNLGNEIYCDHVHFIESVRIQQASFIAGWLSCYIAQP